MSNVINFKDVYKEMEEVYKSYDLIFDNGDVNVCNSEGIYELSVDISLHKNVDELKDHCLECFNECKETLEDKYGLADTTQYIYGCSVDYEIDHIEDAELYAINFNIPDISTVNEVYDWICKAIKTIHNIK